MASYAFFLPFCWRKVLIYVLTSTLTFLRKKARERIYETFFLLPHQLLTPGRTSYRNSPLITMQYSHFSFLCFTAPGIFALDLRKKFRRVIRRSPFFRDVLRSKQLQRHLFSITQNNGISKQRFSECNIRLQISLSLSPLSLSLISLLCPITPFSLSRIPPYLASPTLANAS